ncbi:MAG: Aldose 1-epimerase, partial [Verrucomicrobiales bacterium]|nr:Aldose 1-epimerase [Verrucomicrobiales bacterium]
FVILLAAAVLQQAAVAQSAPPDRVTRGPFGKMPDGQAVELITLKNATGMSAEIISYGAIIKELRAPDPAGKFTNVVLTTGSLDSFRNGFNGAAAITGRVVNRIAGAQFKLEGKTYRLTPNENNNTIHGGKKGFAQSVWTVEDAPAKKDESSIRLVYLSPDGEEGFPGNLKTTVTYSLTDRNEFRIDYFAESDRPTIANLTNHAYFNLSGEGSCLDNILMIPADRYTPSDMDLIPTGAILPLAGTAMDFRRPTAIGARMGQLRSGLNGYDHNFVLNGGREMKLAARLSDPKSGRIMEVRTTQPAVQLYTANHLDHTAVCLETQHFPDAIHHKAFPSIVVAPGKPLEESTVFSFLTK